MTTRSSRRWIAASGGLVLAATLALPASADNGKTFDPKVIENKIELASKVRDAKDKVKLESMPKRLTAFVELETPSVLEAQAAPAQAEKQVEAKAQEVAQAIEGDSTMLYTTTNAISGFAVEADGEALTKLAERDDVKMIRPMTIHTIGNAPTGNLTRAIEAWQATGKTGKDVTIAVVDSGVDFTHTGFGGEGDYSPYADKAARAQAPEWPQGKVIGGWDFVGETYWGENSTATPDPNPIDVAPSVCDAPSRIDRSGGHGTHVAGTAAGFGVNADGSTFEGDYTTLTADEVSQMKIGPGSAPEANILAFKVFGCAGSTAFVAAALDDLLAKDANGDWKWKDVDVVNMSLGSNYSSVADPENVIIEKLFSERGIISVVASGNAGDLYDIGGAPGNAPASLTVANSIHGTSYSERAHFDLNGTAVDLDGQYSVSYLWPEGTVGPLDVVKLDGANAEACDPLTDEDAAKIAGKAALIDWVEQPALKCGSKQRFDNIANAGGKAVILPSDVTAFTAGIAGNDKIPGFQLLRAGTQDVTTALAAGPVTVTLSPTEFGTSVNTNPELVDTLAPSSSRGVHGSLGSVKPDVAAPGTDIVSTGVGTGNGSETMTGTSMATPHVAGIAALVKEAKPDWSATQQKASIMNTAFHDIKAADALTYGPQRVGSGRVDALAAVENSIVMYDSEQPELASVNFGVIEFGQQGYEGQHKVTIENNGSEAASLALSYRSATEVPGVSFSVAPANVSIPAGGKQEVTVTMTVDAGAFRKVIDPTMPLEQLFSNIPLVREYISTATGRLIAEGTGAPENGELRLPISAAPKPVSNYTSSATMQTENKGVISHSGWGFSYPAGHPGKVTDLLPIAMPLEYVGESGPLELTENVDKEAEAAIRATDIRRVGVRVDASAAETPKDTRVLVGVETWGAWPMNPLRSTNIFLEIEAKGKTFTVEPQRLARTDLVLVPTFDSAGNLAHIEFNNDAIDARIDTNTMDTRVKALPFNLASLGFTDDDVTSGNVDLKIRVQGFSWYAPSPSGLTDAFEFNFNPTQAAFTFNTPYEDTAWVEDGQPIPFQVNESALAGTSAISGQTTPQAVSNQPIGCGGPAAPIADQVQVFPAGDDIEPQIMMIHFHNGGATPATDPCPAPAPSDDPTDEPTVAPTDQPTEEPTVAPTDEPTVAPTDQPTAKPTGPGKPPLPITGSDLALPGLIALGLLSAGGALAIRKRAAQQ